VWHAPLPLTSGASCASIVHRIFGINYFSIVIWVSGHFLILHQNFRLLWVFFLKECSILRFFRKRSTQLALPQYVHRLVTAIGSFRWAHGQESRVNMSDYLIFFQN
jgi:hypothetical protein